MIRTSIALAALLTTAAPALAQTQTVTGTNGTDIQIQTLEDFDGAWAMSFLPDGRSVVTEKGGDVWLLETNGKKIGKIANTPKVTERGQGGMGDFILAPDYETSGQIFISYVERDADDDSLSGAAVERATFDAATATLSNREVIWRQSPKVTGNGHYGHRLVISPDDKYLFISSGERQKFTPSQNMEMNLGKILRLNLDGSIPEDNPFFGQGGVTDEIWSLGHRNPLGIDFDANGQLWNMEMGPRHGDELNRVVRGENYGYPEVSNGDHYSGEEIPDHDTRPEFENPAAYWVPAISPGGFVIYTSDVMSDFTGNAFIAGLSSKALVRVGFEQQETDNTGAPPSKDLPMETVAKELERFEWDKRIREVEEGPDGALYVLEDQEGRLLRVTHKP